MTALRLRLLIIALIFASVSFVYRDHFWNSFHFDDFHAIVNNPSVRSLSNIPNYFVDAKTFSNFPPNQSYRPLVTLTLALDFALAGGYDPFYFHLTTFIVFLAYLLTLGFLYERLLGDTSRAWLVVAFFGLHPVSAETVNYIIQRADLYVAWSLALGMLLYLKGRQYLALVVFLLGGFAKPTALVFPGVVAAYEFFLGDRRWRWTVVYLFAAALQALLILRFTPATFLVGSVSSLHYRMTQPYLSLTYFAKAFLPVGLAADHEMLPFMNLLAPEPVAGYVFVILAFSCAIRFRGVVGFGVAWFALSLLVTSVVPLSDVTNDHRMFGPLAATSLVVGHWIRRFRLKWLLLLVLPLYAWQATERNSVWKDDVSLWSDCVKKRPANARAWLNLGVAYLAGNQPEKALQAMLEADKLSESYVYLEVNLGMVYGRLGMHDKAEERFKKAMRADPGGTPRYLFGEYLYHRGRIPEALALLQEADRRNPHDRRPAGLRDFILQSNVASAKANPGADSYINLSMLFYVVGDFKEALVWAERACTLQPTNPYAQNNLAACLLALGENQRALIAAEEALSRKPGFKLAEANVSRALEALGSGASK